MKKFVVVLAGITLLGAGAAWAGENEKLRAIGEGKCLYLTHCASCHGGRGLGGTAIGEDVGEVPDLTLIEHRDGTFKTVHVALHVENINDRGPMPQWKYALSHHSLMPSELQIVRIVRYLDTIQRPSESAPLADEPRRPR